jgi:hypothetical protein
MSKERMQIAHEGQLRVTLTHLVHFVLKFPRIAHIYEASNWISLNHYKSQPSENSDEALTNIVYSSAKSIRFQHAIYVSLYEAADSWPRVTNSQAVDVKFFVMRAICARPEPRSP